MGVERKAPSLPDAICEIQSLDRLHANVFYISLYSIHHVFPSFQFIE